MYKHSNSASRLHALLSQALRQPDQPIYQVMAKAFDVKGKNDQETAGLVLTRLTWFFAELDLLEAQARSSNLSPHLYDAAFNRVRSVLSPINFGGGWQAVKGNLTPDVLLAFAFLNELLPDEESAIPGDALKAITDAASELESKLEDSDLPDPLRNLIQHHVHLIKMALAQYPIHGAKALREVARTAVGEIIEVQGTIVVPPNTEEVSKLERLWKHLNTAADTALKAEKIGQLGQRAIDLLQSLGQ